MNNGRKIIVHQASIISRNGMTLVELMVAVAVVVIAIVGAMVYRYHSALAARRADIRMTGTRVASMLLEGWVAAKGYASYNPVAVITDLDSDMEITTSGSGPAVPGGFTQLGKYYVRVNSSDYYATLSYKSEASDKVRLLNADVAWKHRYMTGGITSTDPSAKMTTYVRFPGDPNSE